MSLVAIPTSDPTPATSASRRRGVYLIAMASAILVISVAWWLLSPRGGMASAAGPSSGGNGAPGAWYMVVPMDLEVKIVKDGELAAVNAIDIVCQVEGSTTIQTIVKEGASVKKGDVLCTLDASLIKQKIEDTTLELQKAEADLTTSKEMKEIQESQNAANLEAADVALTLAKLDLQAYTEGVYPQDLQNAQTALEMAKITLKNTQEDLAQTMNLFSKGFVTASDVKKSELAVTTAKNEVAKSESALKVLTDYQHEKDTAAMKNALSQAEQKLVRTKRENAANLSQKVADVEAKEQALAVMKRRMERYQEQLAACTITAPADGMVVYASSGDRNAQNPIQEGATVRERQTILRLPDTTAMKAIVRIQEAQVGKLTEGQRALVHIGPGQDIRGTVSKISVLADNSQRWWNPDLKEYPVDVLLDQTPSNLKPGMSCTGEVFVSKASQCIAVPLQTIYSVGNDAYVFTDNGDAPAIPTKVTVARTNDTHAEITSGLGGGVRVKLLEAGEGRVLLERAGIKVEAPTNRSNDDDYRSGNGSKTAGKKGPGKDNGSATSAGPGVPSGPGVPASNGENRKRQNRERDRSPSTAPSETSPQ
jgi:HlyD family secretion protein